MVEVGRLTVKEENMNLQARFVLFICCCSLCLFSHSLSFISTLKWRTWTSEKRNHDHRQSQIIIIWSEEEKKVVVYSSYQRLKRFTDASNGAVSMCLWCLQQAKNDAHGEWDNEDAQKGRKNELDLMDSESLSV